jgi:hypothetical protein
MSVQKETNVSQTKPRALLFWNSQKWKSPHDIPSPLTISPI